jgi:hypothetical protein
VIVASWLGGDCRQPRRSARRPAPASKDRKALGPLTLRRIAQPAPVVAILEVSAGIHPDTPGLPRDNPEGVSAVGEAPIGKCIEGCAGPAFSFTWYDRVFNCGPNGLLTSER